MVVLPLTLQRIESPEFKTDEHISVITSNALVVCDLRCEMFTTYVGRVLFFFFSSRRRHTRFDCDWSSDVCSSDLFASFVGYRGAEAFFRSRHDTLDARRAAARWRDERTLDVFYAELARRLDSAYAEPLSGDRVEQVRTTLFGWARDQFRGPVGQSLETYDWRWFAQAPINNAVIIAERLYRMNLNLFDEIYLQNNADISETIRAIQIRVFTQSGDPYQALYSRPGMKVED